MATATDIHALGARVRALREAEGLSLRDLSERSGVSAPMLSQVERGETSPTLAIAERIAAGLQLRLSQLLRLDESGAVAVVRAAERRKGGGTKGHARPAEGGGGGGGPGAPPRGPPPPARPGPARGGRAPGAAGGPPRGGAGRPADARARQP